MRFQYLVTSSLFLAYVPASFFLDMFVLKRLTIITRQLPKIFRFRFYFAHDNSLMSLQEILVLKANMTQKTNTS